MKKLIFASLLVIGMTLGVFASDTNGLFQANEFSLSLGSGYVVDRSAAFQQDYSLNLNAGVQYFPTRNFGLEVAVPFYQTKGVSVDEVQAGLLFRVPLSKTSPLLKNIAPYIGAGAVYNWNDQENWAYIAKAGVEFRLNAYWGIFAEGQYRNKDFDWNKGSTSINGGLRLVF